MLKYAELRDKASEKYERASVRAKSIITSARSRVRERIEENRAEEKRVRPSEGFLDVQLTNGWREVRNEINEVGKLEFETHQKRIHEQDGDFYTVTIETPAVESQEGIEYLEEIAEDVVNETDEEQAMMEAELKRMNRDLTETVPHVSLTINYVYAGYLNEESDVQVPTQKPAHRVQYEVDGVDEAEERVQELIEEYDLSEIEDLLEEADEKELLA